MNGCVKCNCDEFGSTSQQCDHLGKCKCKPNISGDKCNKCEENYFNFTVALNTAKMPIFPSILHVTFRERLRYKRLILISKAITTI